MERSQAVRALLDLADVVDIPTAAEGYTGQQERDEATGDYLDKNTHALAQALYERQVPVVWNDLIRELERIRKRKNQSPLCSRWLQARKLFSGNFQDALSKDKYG